MADQRSDASAGSAASAAAAQRPICAICYEDLRPVAELLQCVPACGHVFHELCLQQWLEYCPAGKSPTCPMCKASCGTHHHKPTRLYFQSTTDGGSTQHSSAAGLGLGFDAEKLAEVVVRLEKKNSALIEMVEAMKSHTKKLTEEIQVSQDLVKSEKARLEDLNREKLAIQVLLNVKVEEVLRKTMECNKLQEKSLALAKELAALKLSTDMNLGEEEIVKFAYLGHSNNPENAVDVLKRSLAMRNKSYKELMTQCNILGRSESRLQQKLEKAKDQIKKLKTQLLELEKENEERENAVLRDLKYSKKLKAEGKRASFMNSCTVEAAINIEDDPDFTDHEELLGCKPRTMNNGLFSNKNSKIDHLHTEQKTSPCEAKNEAESNSKENLAPLARPASNWVKGISLIEGNNKQPTSLAVPQNEVETEKPNSSFDNLHLPIWTTGGGGINRSTAKWCIKNAKTQANGDLIAVGPDGRGGRVKVLRSTNHYQEKPQASRPNQKVGTKGSQFQIEHFFGKK